MSDKKALLQAIAKEEALLSKQDSEREQVLSRINPLKQQLAALDAACAALSITCIARTPREKVSLFRSLFRGREDIFPTLWTSRAGKKGYSPFCSNDWMSGTCGKTHKPPIKCSECSTAIF